MFSSDEEDDIELNTSNFISSTQYQLVATMPSSATSVNSSSPTPRPRPTVDSQEDSDSEVPIYTAPEAMKKKTKPYYWVISAFAAIGGFLFGYDTGIMSGAMLLLKDRFLLSSFWQELIISVTIGCAAVAALLGGILNDKCGRKGRTFYCGRHNTQASKRGDILIGLFKSLGLVFEGSSRRKFVVLLSSFIFVLGAVILGISQNKEMLLIGRCILGVAIGLSSMTIPMYIAECTPSELRGRLVTLNLLFVTGGQCFASVMAGAFSYIKSDGWRYMLGLAAAPALIQLIGIVLLPESPRWLMKKGKEEKARAVLMKLKGVTNVDADISRIKTECENEQNYNKSEILNFVRIMQTPHVRRAVVLGCSLQLFQQLSGINTVMYYSATVIKMSGVQDEHMAIWLSAVTAAVNFIFTLVGLYLVEKIGRKKLIMSSLFGVMLSLVLMAVTFQLIAMNSPDIQQNSTALLSPCSKYRSCDGCTTDMDCGFCYTGSIGSINGSCLPADKGDNDHSTEGACMSPNSFPSGVYWAFDYCPTKYSWMAVLGLVLYLMFFAPGMGPMPWAINSEIYPLWARSTGNSLSTATNWTCNLIVSMTFLTLTETITKYGTYWIFVGICVLALAFFAVYLPETKGHTLEEVEELFMQPWCQCCGGDSHRKAYRPLDPPDGS